MAWASKGKYFIAAACMLLAVSLMCFGRTAWDGMNHKKNSSVRLKTTRILNDIQGAQDMFANVQNEIADHNTAIDKEFEPFEHREIVPLLYETILSALPNTENNQKQARLYKAFTEGDVQAMTAVPRRRRKQIFITSIQAYFTYDLAAGQFGGADLFRSSRGMPGGEGLEDEYGEYEYEMMMMEEMGEMGMYSPMGFPGATTAEEKDSGFVVTVVGYSPYGNNTMDLSRLIDPPGVETQPDRWGLVTRLAHLDDFVEDGTSPFELYKKDEVPEQFGLEIKEVSWDEEIPRGIGVQEIRYKTPTPAPDDRGEYFLVDPMTKEIINRIPELDEKGRQRTFGGKDVYIVNDHWFVLNLKFIWRDAPEPPEQPMNSMYPGMRR